MKHHSAQFKAQVIGEWVAGASLDSLAKAHAIPKSTVQRWMLGRTRTEPVRKTNEPDQDTIDDIAWRHVHAGAAASEAILVKAADAGWLDKQNAADLAILYGVIADKQLRLLAAYQRDDLDRVKALPPGSN